MMNARKGRSADAREMAETIAIQALAFLADDPARLAQFFLASGLEPADVRARAGSSELQGAILEYLASDESLLLVFAQNSGVAPESIGGAIAALQASPP